MSKGGKDQVVRQELDPMTRDYMKRVYGAAGAAASQPYTPYQGPTVAGVSDLTPEAAQRWQGLANFGMTGAGAMAGDPTAIASMMNPYLATMNPYWDQQRQSALSAVGDQATRAGAFGGGRHGVAEGQALADIGNAQAAQQYGAFEAAMGRAGQLANLGLSANAAQFGAGDYFRNVQQQQLDDNYKRFVEARDWDQRNLGILSSVMGGPYGQVQSTPTERNLLTGALGGAATGSAFGPIGAGIGGGLGLLGII